MACLCLGVDITIRCLSRRYASCRASGSCRIQSCPLAPRHNVIRLHFLERVLFEIAFLFAVRAVMVLLLVDRSCDPLLELSDLELCSIARDDVLVDTGHTCGNLIIRDKFYDLVVDLSTASLDNVACVLTVVVSIVDRAPAHSLRALL